MLNPDTATRRVIDSDAIRAQASSFEHSTEARFAPLFTRATELAIGTVTDELGRPLVGVFVPDSALL
jgi:hypothetical protein